MGECYMAMMEMDEHFQAMNIEEHRTVIEPIERLEEILLDDSNLIKRPRLVPLLAQRSAKHLRLFSKITEMYLLEP